MAHGLFPRVLLAVAFLPVAFAWGDDWPEWRGPRRDGHSLETGLPAKWSPTGENLAWKAPFGARATPVIFGNRLYVLHPSVDPVKERAKTEELLSCLDADTGKVLWQHAIRVFHSDVPTHRVGWASPSVDPATGNVYVFGVHDELSGFSGDGKPLWSRSITEEFGAISTHGGRTVSPVIVGDLVIVSTLTAGWGDQARGNNRWFAFDKLTGQTVWVSNPQPRHYDTNYSTPAVFDVDGATLLVVGGSDGAMHAIKAATGEAVWAYEMSKRAILTSPVVSGTTVYVSHSEENLDSNEMGLVAAIDGTSKGTLKLDQAKWRTIGFQGGFASPVIDGERLYQADNGGVLGAFDLATGKKVWEKPMGTLQKASPVFADGKLYLATENGKFFILEPSAAGVKVLDEDVLGPTDNPEIIVASPAIARGRIYLASMDHLYAIGPKKAAKTAPRRAAPGAAPAAAGEPTFVQVRPYESLIKPGEKVTLTVKLYDAKGRFVRDEPGAAWSVEGLKGEAAAGVFTAAADARNQAGTVVATVGALKGTARVRVAPPLPWSYDFETLTTDAPPPFWVNSTGKYAARDKGTRAIAKLTEPQLTKRGRVFMGPPDMHDYTVEADVLATEKRRQMGDGGVIAQRYALVLFGNGQKIELHPWQANPARTVEAPFTWKADTWYRVKLKVSNIADGTSHVQGKAWPSADPEPAAWNIDFKDTMPHRQGSPGLYADAPAEVFFDNVKVSANQ